MSDPSPETDPSPEYDIDVEEDEVDPKPWTIKHITEETRAAKKERVWIGKWIEAAICARLQATADQAQAGGPELNPRPLPTLPDEPSPTVGAIGASASQIGAAGASMAAPLSPRVAVVLIYG